MLFNSIHFLIFFATVVLLYYTLPQKYRWILLLSASYYFYMSWNVKYILLILFSTLVNYFVAILIAKTEDKRKRKIFLTTGIVTNLGLLFVFKYFNFVSLSVSQTLAAVSLPVSPPLLSVLLPIGISFYTFQTLSYTIDVYKNKIKPEKHLGIFALYVSFFPQLVAGPIERAKNLLPQFVKKHIFESKKVLAGLRLMLWGFFLKVVVADRLAIFVDKIYNNVSLYTGSPLILATFFFSFQIYADFAGYSFIAIGAAKVLGFSLMDNFRRPYYSKSIAEFWRRWHISLSTWFQDYVFNPLYLKISKNRILKKMGYKKKHLLSFMVSIIIGDALLGLWHGANWTFLFFGLYHGVLIFGHYLIRNQWKKINSIIRIVATFILVNLSFVFFRANTLSDAWYIFKNMLVFGGLNSTLVALSPLRYMVVSLFFIFFVVLIEITHGKTPLREFLLNKPRWLRNTIIALLILLILLFGVFGSRAFIYFQF